MCRFAANFDYRSASEKLARQGIDVSHTTLHDKVHEWSKDLRALEQVECQTLTPYERWYVSTDGCRTNSPEGWKETKVIPFIQNNIPFNKLSVCSRAIHCASDIPGVCKVFGIHLFIHCRRGFRTPILKKKIGNRG